ncbi:MAG TPA: LCP family protein [Candidatus Saccharimonadales bacterium]|nr:LCP family protein [Candidatus Saccharimonadales bacterium]
MHRKPQAIDGFIPRSPQTRYVGFDNRPKLSNSPQGVRVRRPGFSAQQPTDKMSSFSARSSSLNTQSNQLLNQSMELPEPKRYESRDFSPPATSKKKRQKSKKSKLRKFVKTTSLIAAAFLILCGGWLGWKLFRDTSKVFGSSSSLLGFLSASKLKCEDTGRCNIILAGNSADDPFHNGANLTDSIMLISIDTKNDTAIMMSIPRDLYVNIPGNGYAKINEAYPDGQSEHYNQNGYAKGGMGLLEQTVSESLGIDVSYYALIDYSALRQAVNTVGGVPVNVQSEDPRGLYDPSIDWKTHGPLVKLSNGWHTLTGEQALDLARARGDAYGSYGFSASDFARTQNQRALMLAIKDKAMSNGTLANPLKLGQLFDAFGNNVHTDLSTGNIRRLYDLSKVIPSNKIKSIGLNSVTINGQKDVSLLKGYTTTTGQSALIPTTGLGDYSQIKQFLQQVMSNNALAKEGANVVVLNASTTTGLATAESNVLSKKGIYVSTTANATPHQDTTFIIDNSSGKNPATLKALKNIFGISTTSTNASLTKQYPDAAFIVVLGQNQQMPQ